MAMYYMHKNHQVVPAGCTCKHSEYTCNQCASLVDGTIQSMLLGPEQMALPHLDMNVYRIPNIVNCVVRQLIHIEGFITPRKTSDPHSNNKTLRNSLLKGLGFLIQIIANSVNCEERGLWYGYPNSFEIDDKFVASNVKDIVATCGKIVNIIVRQLIGNSDVDQNHTQVCLTMYTFLVAYVARCQKITIPAFPERAIPFLFHAAIGNTMHQHIELSKLALFCVANICKPDHQFCTSSSPSPVFQIVWDGYARSDFLSQGYICAASLLEKLCLLLKRPALSEGELEAVLNIVHGASSINLSVARGFFAHDEFLDLLSQRILSWKSVKMTLFLTQLALFNEAVQSLYHTFNDIWDKGLLAIKLARILLYCDLELQYPIFRACISLWGSPINYCSMEPVAPMTRMPFILDILRTFWDDAQKATPQIWADSDKRTEVIDSFVMLDIETELRDSEYSLVIDNAFQCMKWQLDGFEYVVEQDMDAKSAELKQIILASPGILGLLNPHPGL